MLPSYDQQVSLSGFGCGQQKSVLSSCNQQVCFRCDQQVSVFDPRVISMGLCVSEVIIRYLYAFLM